MSLIPSGELKEDKEKGKALTFPMLPCINESNSLRGVERLLEIARETNYSWLYQ